MGAWISALAGLLLRGLGGVRSRVANAVGFLLRALWAQASNEYLVGMALWYGMGSMSELVGRAWDWASGQCLDAVSVASPCTSFPALSTLPVLAAIAKNPTRALHPPRP